MVIVVRKLIEEGTRFKDESGEDHLTEVHPRPNLLEQKPDE